MIFSKRKITIVGDKANIDKQIVLYRGDREIEIQFEIVYEVIRYRMPNAIEEANASFGQLIIQNDSAPTLTITNVSPTNEGVVIFKFTKEMIDEISELGAYNFQIRLFDDTQTSRITTPIVENGIIIKEPLSIYEGDVQGGSAEAGVALTGTARVQQEEHLEPFDQAGNYNETTWATGDIITSGKLNKLEDGITGVNQKVEGITVPTKTSQLTNDSGYTTETYVTSKIAEAQLSGGGGTSIDDTTTATNKTWSSSKIDSQIKEKVSLNQGSEYAGNYLGISGDGSVVPMPVIGGGTSETTYELIGTLPQKTTFSPVQLLANEDTAITIGDNASYPISDKIVDGSNLSNSIYFTNIESYEFNDTNGITMKRVDGAIPNNAYLYIAVPVTIGTEYTISFVCTNGAYVRVGECNTNVKIIEGSSTTYVGVTNLTSYITTQDIRQSLTYTPTKKYIMLEVRPWTNQTATVDQIMVSSTGLTTYTKSTTINLTGGEYYEYVNTIGETIPASTDGTIVELYKKTGGSDFSTVYSYVDNQVATKLDKSGYTESGNLIVDEHGNVAIEQGLANENVYVFLGDSIPTFDSNTGGIGAIPDYMKNLIGGTWHNFGIGGTTMASYRLSNNTYDMFTLGEWADSIANGNFTNQETGVTNGVEAGSTGYSASNKVADAKALDWSTVDTICIHFGTNDLAYKVSELGTSDDPPTKNGTMCASLKYAIGRIHSAFPKVKIVVCGIIYRYADGIPISSIITANEQLKKTCYTEGIRFVDLFGEMEVNTTNRTTFLYDGTHPNANGKQRYAECLSKYIY